MAVVSPGAGRVSVLALVVLFLALGLDAVQGRTSAGGSEGNAAFLRKLAYSRKLAASSTATLARLQAAIYTPTLYSDTRTCRTVGAMVARGSPLGCGTGCQWAGNVTSFSSAFINNGVSSALSITGPPDVYPSYGDNPNAWSPAIENFGSEYIQFTITQAVFVTSINIYETQHPGSVIKIEGRSNTGGSPGSWVTLWSGLPSPTPLPFDPFSSVERQSAARVFSPPISAPLEVLLNEFKITLNTDKTVVGIGYNEIDAVGIQGDGSQGQPLNSYTPLCATTSDTNCFYACTSSDLLSDSAAQSLLTVAEQAVAWLTLALRVIKPPYSSLVLATVASTDPSAQFCGDVPIPAALLSGGAGYWGAHTLIFLTGRPYPAGVPTVLTCRVEANFSAATGRPVALWLNVPPTFASTALAASSGLSGTVTNEPQQGAVDTLIHYLFRGLGWGASFQASYGLLGTPSVTTSSSTGSTFATRAVVGITTAKAVAAAVAHFGGAVATVELESQGGVSGIAGALLESRVYRGELMAAPGPTGRPLAKSNISLAYLEDSGWYTPDYSVAVPLVWGRGLGASFATSSCNNWPSGAANYVCPLSSAGVFDVTQNLTASCTYNRVAKGSCLIQQYPVALPAAYQYFGGPPNSAFAGVSAYADYCPVVDVLTQYGSGDCRLAANTPAPNAAGEEFGPASRCFSYVKQAATRLGCFKHTCVNGALWVKLVSAWLPCPDASSVTSPDGSFVVACPKAAELCDPYASSVPPTITVYSVTSSFTSLLTVAGTYPNSIDIGIEVANFAVPAQGSIQVLVSTIVHATYTLPVGGPVLNATLRVAHLPAGALTMTLNLVDARGAAVATTSFTLTVALQFAQWASAATNFSSQYASYVPGAPPSANRLVAAILGANDCLPVIADTLGRSAYGSCAAAWAPSRGGAGPNSEYVDVRVPTPVYLTGVEPFEVFSPGAFTKAYAAMPGVPLPPSDDVYGSARQSVTVPSTGQPIGTTVAAVSPRSYTTSVVRLVFSTPSWVEVDAVRLWGYVDTPAALSLPVTSPTTFGLVNGVTATVTITVANAGTSTLHWVLTPLPATVAWAAAVATSGVTTGGASFVLQFVLNTTLATSAFQSTPLVVTDRYSTVATASLLSSTLGLQVSYVAAVAPAVPLCYHGIVVGASAVSGGACLCDPGAYGLACEYLTCPSNCSSTAVVTRGVCDRPTGGCACLPGFNGLDCSGQDGDCYLAYDGTCRPGWTPGTYVLNAEDTNNLNRAAGSVPAALQCSASPGTSASSMSRPVNTYGCSPYSTFAFCCRPKLTASCPFASQALTCGSAACSAITDVTSLMLGTSTATPAAQAACLSAVTTYCYGAAYDAACASGGVLQRAVPSTYCPSSLVLAYCALYPADTDCAVKVVAPRPLCGFAAVTGSPCADPRCAAGVFTAACQPAIDAYCATAPGDMECDLHGRLDGCLFVAGAAPCTSPYCLLGTPSYSATGCATAVAAYCSDATQSLGDIECGIRGYGTAPADFASLAPTNGSASCAWAVVAKQCVLTPTAPECLRLRAGGFLPTPQTAASYTYGTALAAPLVAYASAAAANFTAAAAALDVARQSRVLRLSLYTAAFAAGDTSPADGVLTAAEAATVQTFLTGISLATAGSETFQGVGGAAVASPAATYAALVAAAALTGGELSRAAFTVVMDALG